MEKNRIQTGYCLDRTRREIRYLPFGILGLFLGCFGGYFGIFRGGINETGPVLTLLTSVILLLLGGAASFVAIRNCFFPEKSTLAHSIRSQLPYPDEAPAVKELFAMVDRDLQENGIWYGPVCIGREWVLGDEANLISRIRGIFTVDKIRHNNGRLRREMALVLVDDRWQKTRTDFLSPRELQAAADCLALRVPGARRGKDPDQFTGMCDEAKDAFLQKFNVQQAKRQPKAPPQTMTLTRADGSATSRVNAELLRQTLRDCQKERETVFFLTPSRKVAAQGVVLTELECTVSGYGAHLDLLLKEASTRPDGAPERGFLRQVRPAECEEILFRWFRGEVPDLAGWKHIELRTPVGNNPF